MKVYLTPRYRHTREIYHTSKDCNTIQQTEKLREKEKADLPDGYRACQHPSCEGEKGSCTTPKECPYCGESVTHLSYHLPDCEET